MMGLRFRSELTRVPGVRIAVGRRGLSTTIAWGGSAQASSALQTIGNHGLSGPLPTDRYLIPGTRTDFGGGNVSDMTSPGLSSFKALILATGQRQRDITADLGRAKWQLCMAWTARALGWVTLASVAVRPVREAAQRGLALRRTEVATLRANLDATAISVDFDMESAVGGPHGRMQDAFDRIAACQRIWAIDCMQRIDRVKARSLAGTVVGRRTTVFGRSADPLIRTQEAPLACAVQGNRSTAYFYPGFVLVAAKSGGDFALIDFADLDVRSGIVDFTETEAVPSDSTVVGSAWAKSNKNGTRDKRFAHNRQLPIAGYGELQFASPGGLSESFMTSRAEPCEAFAAALREVKQILSSARTDKAIRGRKAIGGHH